MQNELLIAVLTGLGGMLGWGFADFFAKKTIDRIGDVTTLFWSLLIGVVPLLLLFAWHPLIPSKLSRSGSIGLLYLVILGIWDGLSYIPTYVAFGKGKVSLLSPIFASYAVVVALLSAIIFGESISDGRWLALGVVFIGILLISGDLRRLGSLMIGRPTQREDVKGLKEILFAIVFYSLWLIALDRFINGQYWVPFLLMIRISAALALFVYAKIRRIPLRLADTGMWKYLILVGCFDVAAFASLSYGYSATPYVSIVTMLSAAFSLPTILLGRLFLKERASFWQTAGSCIIILGVVLLPLL